MSQRSLRGESRLLTLQPPITVSQPKLSWRDSVLPVLCVVGGAIIVLYALSPFISGLFIYWFFFTSHDPTTIVAANLGVIAIIGVVVGALLARKARGRQVGSSYYVPPGIVGLCFFALFISAATRLARQEESARRYQIEVNALNTTMQDPGFLMNLKPPLSLAQQTAVIAALNNNQRVVGTPLTNAEVHAVLTNLGSNPLIERAAAACGATSVEDLQWLSVHGGKFARQSVGLNPHAPQETLRRLMNDPDPDVQFSTGYAAAESGCDSSLLRTFWDRESAKDQRKDEDSFRRLAGNSCTPKDILESLTAYPGDVGQKAKATLLKHP